MSQRQLTVRHEESGQTILGVLSRRLVRESKTRLRRLVAGGEIRVNGHAVSPGTTVRRGDTLELSEGLDLRGPPPQAMDLEVVREDEQLLVLAKPAGVPVLPTRDGAQREFYDSLLAHVNRDAPDGGPYVRPHLVHRLDRETSGVMLVAKTVEAGRNLSRQFEHRRVSKRYLAVVEGVLPVEETTLQIPLCRSSSSVVEMVPNQKRGKPAETHLVLERRFGHFCLVQAAPLTGRQHQIRVHLAAIGYPLAVDFLYGRRERLDGREFNRIVGRPELPPERTLLDRCPLHAARIEYRHPQSGELMAAEAPLPSDMKRLLEVLESHDPPA